MKIILKDINKAFGEKTVLKGFNATINENKITAIMGESGVGKTTLLRILMGLENADSGTVSGLEGKGISVVFQEDRLLENLSSLKNVLLTSKEKYSKDEIQSFFENLKLTGIETKPIKELSGGMKRRVALLRGLVSEYDVLLLDEPFKGLDVDTKEITINFFRERVKNKTVIIVTHDKSEAELLNADIIEM